MCVSAEILDYGYPQNTDTGILKTFITQQGVKSQVCEILLTQSGPPLSRTPFHPDKTTVIVDWAMKNPHSFLSSSGRPPKSGKSDGVVSLVRGSFTGKYAQKVLRKTQQTLIGGGMGVSQVTPGCSLVILVK